MFRKLFLTAAVFGGLAMGFGAVPDAKADGGGYRRAAPAHHHHHQHHHREASYVHYRHSPRDPWQNYGGYWNNRDVRTAQQYFRHNGYDTFIRRR